MAHKNSERRGILLEAGTNEVEFLVILLGNQRYGINVAKICHISVFDPSVIAEMPNQRPEVLGVASLRDETISIIDLSINLKRKQTANNVRKLLILAEFNSRKTGFVVDGVERIERVNWKRFEPIDNATCDGGASSVVGTVTGPEGLIIILDLESILADIDPSMSVEHFAKEIPAPTFSRDTIRVLHCEDSVVIQKLVFQVLKESGFKNIEQVNNGEDALEYAQRVGPGGIDIVLSDIEMPIMDGLSLCKKLRQDDRYSRVPVVFFSSMINDQMMAKCKSVGGDAAFSKPQINQIVGCIDNLIREKHEQGR
jgi:two-component system chemotaxis response regulator CheV